MHLCMFSCLHSYTHKKKEYTLWYIVVRCFFLLLFYKNIKYASICNAQCDWQEWIIFIFSVAAIVSVRSTLPPSSPLPAPLSTRPLNISNFAIFAGVAPTSLISLDARLKFFTSFSITSVGHSFVVSQIFALLIKYLKKKTHTQTLALMPK